MTVYDQINGKTFAQMQALSRPVTVSVLDDVLVQIPGASLAPAVRTAIANVRGTVANTASTDDQIKLRADQTMDVATTVPYEKAGLVSAHDAGYACWFVMQGATPTNHSASKAMLNSGVSFGATAIQLFGDSKTAASVKILIDGVDALV